VPRYTVVWTAEVERDYTNAWLAADSASRQRLTDIANAIDRELARFPASRGQPLPSNPAYRIWVLPYVTPSASVVFRILPTDQIVRVLRITVATS
jgi:hypothetical protein